MEKGKKGKLINAFSIKPFDTELIRRVAKNVDKIVTVENHSILGGLGSLVAETICSLDNHAPLEIIGVNDVFTESGPSQEIKEKYGFKNWISYMLNLPKHQKIDLPKEYTK